jgi:hypothetical protein
MGDDDLLTLAQAAAACGVAVEVLYLLIVRGQLSAERDVASGRWRVRRAALRRFEPPANPPAR